MKKLVSYGICALRAMGLKSRRLKRIQFGLIYNARWSTCLKELLR